jgi:hypothetical protein
MISVLAIFSRFASCCGSVCCEACGLAKTLKFTGKAEGFSH